MLRPCLLTFALAGLLASCSQNPPTSVATAPASALTIATWNLEFLAERDGEGCNPRQATDYAKMRSIADSLGADVIAFQEAENPAAAARVFDPAHYRIVMEQRPGKPGGSCGGRQQAQTFIRQAVGFAIRKDLPFDRAPDVTDLEVGNPNLRSGVDVTIQPAHGRPLRLLSVHLKSGCFRNDSTSDACATLTRQIPQLEKWIDAAAAGPTRFAVLGDWNRRLALSGDAVWSKIDDGEPANARLTLADRGISPHCDPRYHDFIDHIVLDKRAGADLRGFREVTYEVGEYPSDHCPVVATVAG
jgi:endonuclease/exonuclease/phosphatase family metal-dependent hydrolase